MYVSNSMANLQEDSCSKYSSVYYMSACVVQSGSSRYGFAGATIRGVVRYVCIKFLNLNITV